MHRAGWSVRCHEPTSPMRCGRNEKAARGRLLTSNPMIVVQAAIKPRPENPNYAFQIKVAERATKGNCLTL
jgi:hypothetical protein